MGNYGVSLFDFGFNYGVSVDFACFYCYRDCDFFVIGFVGNLISGVRVLMQFLLPPGNIIR